MQPFLVPKTKLDKTLLLRAAVLARQLDGCGTDEIFHRGEICPTIHSQNWNLPARRAEEEHGLIRRSSWKS